MGKRPYVLLSVAMSADGYIDSASGPRLVLSSQEDLDQVDEIRASCDAIMVGAQTIRADDPRLLVKSADRRARRRGLGLPANPIKVTITGSGNLDSRAAFFADDGADKLVYADANGADRLRPRVGERAQVVALPDSAGLAWVLADLAERGIGRLMIEGGSHLLGQALSDDLADELRLAIAPVFVADPAAPRLLAGAEIPGRLMLAETAQAGDTAVLRYLPGARLTGQPSNGDLTLTLPHMVKDGPATVQDGAMSDTKAAANGMQAAIERSGYYPGLVYDAVSSAVGNEQVISYVVIHDAHFDPGMEVRRHVTVMALTPTRLVYSHTDEYPADEADPESRPQAETSTEAVRHSRISSVALTRVIPDPASYSPGATMPSEVVLTIGWNVLSHIEIEPAHCGDDSCEADHGYTGTMTADDLTVRVSEAADGEEAVQQVMAFAQALAEATSRP